MLGLRFDLHYAQVQLYRLTIALLKALPISYIQHLVHMCLTFNSCHIWGLVVNMYIGTNTRSFSPVCVAATPPLPLPCTAVIVLHMAVNEINAVLSKHENVGIYQCLLSTVCSCNTPCVPCMPYRDVCSECTSIPISLICLSGAIARSACVGAHIKCPNLFLPLTNAVGWMPLHVLAVQEHSCAC